jgi:hypothetical protein
VLAVKHIGIDPSHAGRSITMAVSIFHVQSSSIVPVTPVSDLLPGLNGPTVAWLLAFLSIRQVHRQ